MEIKLLQYLFGLKLLVEFHSAFFQSNNCFRVRSILMLFNLEDTEASQFRGQATMMPFWASCSIMYPFIPVVKILKKGLQSLETFGRKWGSTGADLDRFIRFAQTCQSFPKNFS